MLRFRIRFKCSLSLTFCVSKVYSSHTWSYVTQTRIQMHTAISIKVVPEQRGKVEYEREKLAGSDD